MTTATPPQCALGLARADVAAWHDGALDAAQAERRAAHVATCPACQAHLADFEQAERLVRDERVPDPNPHLWETIRAATARRPPIARATLPLGGLGVVAAVLLLALGFSFLFRTLGARPVTTAAPTATIRPSPSNTATPVPTLAPAPIVTGTPLAWQAVTLPPGMSGVNRTDALAPAPSDGATAYACYVNLQGQTGPVEVWQTRNTGGSWVQRTSPASGALGSCSLAVDAADANVVVVGTGGQGAPPRQTDFYLTTDGGATWRALPQGFTIISLATYASGGRRIYAVTSQQQPDSTLLVRLQRSDDGGSTWTPVDAGLRSQNVTPVSVWVRPDTGEMLVSAFDHINEPQLWTSVDGGATWSMLVGPTGGAFIVATPRPGQSWQICSVATASPNANHIDNLICPLNGDPHGPWGPRPQLITPNAAAGNPTYIALLSDGTLLASAPDAPDATASTFRVYRLAPGATQWEDVGPGPEVRIDATLTSGNTDLLWAIPTFGAVLDPQGRVFVVRV